MKLKQAIGSIRSKMVTDSRWMRMAVMCIGLCIFTKAVYFFGFTNFSNLSGGELFLRLILPMVIGLVFLVAVKGFNVNSPIVFGIFAAVYAVDYLLVMDGPETVSAVLMLVNAAAFLAAAFGLLPGGIIIPVIAAIISVLYRVIAVDLNGYILPLNELELFSYFDHASNLFAVLTVGFLTPALRVTQKRDKPREDSTSRQPD